MKPVEQSSGQLPLFESSSSEGRWGFYSKIFSRAWNTFAPTQGDALHGKEITSFQVKLSKGRISEDHLIGSIADILENRGQRLGTEGVKQLFNLYSEIYQTLCFDVGLIVNFHEINEERVKGAIENLKMVAKEKRFIFLPLLISLPLSLYKGSHIALIGIDKQRQEIFYYDSMGSSPPSHLFPFELPFETFLSMIKVGLDLDWDLFSLQLTKQSHQNDFYNCGVYISLTALRLLEGTPLSTILETPWGNREIEGDRMALAQALRSSIGRSIEPLTDTIFYDKPHEPSPSLVKCLINKLLFWLLNALSLFKKTA